MGEIDFLSRKNAIINDLNNTSDSLEKGYQEAKRVRQVVENTSAILDEYDQRFCEKTKLTQTDIAFMFVAIGLQVLRQYLITKFPQRLDDQLSANQTPGHTKEHSDRHHNYYNPSLSEIITNPVPFDANIGANGALSGGGKLGHRATALGHDPLLGLIFGTANIATSTLTTSSFDSYHIFTNQGRDAFRNKARTDLVINHTVKKLVDSGIEGKTIVATSLAKEIVHLKSDIHTKNSLALPIVSTIDPKLASSLASYGLDMSNIVTVSKQAIYSIFINSLIAMIHRLFCESTDDIDLKLYEVRTRRILSYSNAIATSSNIAISAITHNFNSFDLGGLAVTVYRLISDRNFIQKIRQEFIFGNYEKLVMGDA